MRNGTTAEQNQDGVGYPVTRIETISQGVVDSNRVRFVNLTYNELVKWKLQVGDILFSHINSEEHIGKSALYEGQPTDLVHGMNLLLLRPAQDQVLPSFLHYFLRSPQARSYVRARCKKAINQASINQKELGAMEAIAPPLAEQAKVVDLLTRAEGIVRLRREPAAKAAELIPALFIHHFGDPATNPMGWPIKTIEDLCSVQTGATPRREVFEYYEGGTVPWVKTGEVCNGVIATAEEFITERALSETNCKVFPVGTILIAMYGQGVTRGRAAMLNVPAATNQACAAILPSENVNRRFLFEFLRSQYERLRAMGRGGNQANLNLGMIKAFELPLPPIAKQESFVKEAQVIDGICSLQTTALAKAQATFDALLAQAFAPT